MRPTHILRKPVASCDVHQQRQKTLAIGSALALALAAVLLIILVGCGGGALSHVAAPPPPSAQPLQAGEVQSIIQTAVNAAAVDMVVAVVDRAGFVLGVFRTQSAPAVAPGNFGQMQDANDVAVALARTAAFFSNDQATLSTRTVRLIQNESERW